MEKETKRGNGIQEAKSSILFSSTIFQKADIIRISAFFCFQHPNSEKNFACHRAYPLFGNFPQNCGMLFAALYAICVRRLSFNHTPLSLPPYRRGPVWLSFRPRCSPPAWDCRKEARRLRPGPASSFPGSASRSARIPFAVSASAAREPPCSCT